MAEHDSLTSPKGGTHHTSNNTELLGLTPPAELYGPPGLAKKFGEGFALDRPGLINNIINGNGFASDIAGNSINGDNLGTGNNGWERVDTTGFL